MTVMNALRRFAAESPLQPVLLQPRVRRGLASVLALRFVPAAWQVTEPLRFLRSEARRAGTAQYIVRGTGLPLLVRHECGALELVHEIFRERCYDPPGELADYIGTAPSILDIGANVGAFSSFARGQWPASRIVAVEADHDNAEVLEQFSRVEGSGLVTTVEAAASTGTEPVRFLGGLGSGSRIDDSGDIVPAVDVFELLREARFAKIDIEGGEWPILADPRLAEIDSLVVVLEYHRRYDDDHGAGAAAEALLHAAGFTTGHGTPNYWGHGLLWAWKLPAGQA